MTCGVLGRTAEAGRLGEGAAPAATKNRRPLEKAWGGPGGGGRASIWFLGSVRWRAGGAVQVRIWLVGVASEHTLRSVGEWERCKDASGLQRGDASHGAWRRACGGGRRQGRISSLGSRTPREYSVAKRNK